MLRLKIKSLRLSFATEPFDAGTRLIVCFPRKRPNRGQAANDAKGVADPCTAAKQHLKSITPSASYE